MVKQTLFATLFFAIITCATVDLSVAQRDISVEPVSGKGQRWAILVGVNDYVHISNLKYCVNDVSTLRDELLKHGYEKDRMFCLTTRSEEGSSFQPTRANIGRIISQVVKQLQKEDQILIVLSGHGLTVGNRSYFCPEDADPKNVGATSINIEQLYKLLDESNAANKLLIVDACRNRPVNSRKVVQNDVAQNPLAGIRAADGIKGIEKLPLPPPGIVLLSSCNEGEFSFEDSDLGHGVFTYFLIDAIRGKADTNKDGFVSLLELTSYVCQETPLRTMRRFSEAQTPYFKGNATDYILAIVGKDVIRLQKVTGPMIPGFDGTLGKLLWSFGENNPLNARDNHSVSCVAYSPDGSMVASGHSDKTARIWNVLTGKQISSIGHTGDIVSVCFSPSSTLLLSTSKDGLVKVSKVETGEMVSRAFRDPKINSSTWCSAFSPDERHVVIGTGATGYVSKPEANAVYLLDVGNANAKLVRPFVGHKGDVNSVAFSPDRKWLLTGSDDKMLGLWEVQTGRSLNVLQGHTGGISQVAFSPDGKSALSLSVNDNTLRIWNPETGAETRSFTDSKQYFVQAAFSPLGRTVVACVANDKNYISGWMRWGRSQATIKFFDSATGIERNPFVCELKDVLAIALSPDGKTMVIGAHGDGEPTSPPKLQLLSTGLSE